MESSPSPSPDRKFGGLIRMAASIGLVGLIIWWADPQELWELLSNASWLGVAAVIALHVADRILMAYKWWRLLRAREFQVRLADAIRSYFLASFVGAVLPVAGGADLARIAAIRGRGANTEALVASVALERTIGAISHALFCLVSIALLVALRVDLDVSALTLAIAAIAMVALLTAMLPLSFAIAERLAARPEGSGLVGKLRQFGSDYAAWRAQPRELWIFLTLTFLEGLYPILGYWAAASALGLDVTMVQMAIAVPLAFLAARLPIPMFSIGPEQLTFIVVATQLGISAGAAGATTTLFLTSLLVAFAPGAVAWMNTRND